MGLWPRIGVTALVTAATAAGSWRGVEAAGAGQAAALAVASIVAATVVTLGAVWAARAREAGDTGPADGVMVSGSPSGQAIGRAEGPVFGPNSNFAGATIITGAGTVHQTTAPDRAGASPAAPGGGLAGGKVVVGEIPQKPVAFQDRPAVQAALTSPPAGRRVSVVTGLRGSGRARSRPRAPGSGWRRGGRWWRGSTRRTASGCWPGTPSSRPPLA